MSAPSGSDAARILRGLEAHVREQEDALFPVLREIEPEFAPELRALEREHAFLLGVAVELGDPLLAGDGARTIVRTLLAILLRHIRNETELFESIPTDRLDRLRIRLLERKIHRSVEAHFRLSLTEREGRLVAQIPEADLPSSQRAVWTERLRAAFERLDPEFQEIEVEFT